MARDFNSCVLTKAGTILLPKAILIYPSLFEPSVVKGEKDESKARYGASVLIPKAASLDIIVKAVNDLIAEKLTEAQRKVTKVKKPFLKTEEQLKLVAALDGAGYSADDFPVLIRAAAKFKPDIIGPDLGEIRDPEQVYSGRWASISVRPYFWQHPTGGSGVSLGLNNVQLLDHGEVIASGRVSASDEFEAAEGAGSGTTDNVFD